MGNQSRRVIGAFWRILAHIEPRRDSTAESPQILVAVGIPAICHPISKAWPIRHSRTSGPATVSFKGLHLKSKFLTLILAIVLTSCESSDKHADKSSEQANTQKLEPTTPEAQFKLGLAYAEGDGVPQDGAEAERWWKESAKQGYADAQIYLLMSYGSGAFGIKKNEAEGRKLVLAFKESGLLDLQELENKMSDKKSDYVIRIMKWFRKAAEQSDPEAQLMLSQALADGDGMQQDDAESFKWLLKSAENGNITAMSILGDCYQFGDRTKINDAEGLKWKKKAANHGDLHSQYELGLRYAGVLAGEKDDFEAAKWYRMAAENTGSIKRNDLWKRSDAKFVLAELCFAGKGVSESQSEAVKWYRSAAEDNYSAAQLKLGLLYFRGYGTVKNSIDAYKWLLLAAAGGDKDAQKSLPMIEAAISAAERSKGQSLAQEWEADHANREAIRETGNHPAITDDPKITGTGFLITRNGYLVTNHHVVKGSKKIRVKTAAGLLDAMVVRVDAASDLALLKVAGEFHALPVVSSRTVRLGAMVATVGFPNIGLQGFEPKLSKGDISSLAGIQDDVKQFQISVPVQPGNSGGAMFDERGNVIGVVTAQLNQKAALASTGTLAQNVNYAVKSSYLLGFLEAVPEVAGGMLDAKTGERKFEAVVDDVKKATVLIIGY
jgi:TPR repeat protein